MTAIKIFLTGVLFILGAHRMQAQKLIENNQTLDKKQQSIVTISAFMSKGDLVQLQGAFNNGLDAGLTINEVKEILVQLYAYAGFPRSLNAITTLEAVVNERKTNGKKDVTGREASKRALVKNKFEWGKNIQTKLTGSTATGAPQKFVPIIDTFLKAHLFADIFGRDILDYKTREIATISALASLGGAEAQLQSHFSVGLNTGLTEAQLKKIVLLLQTMVGSKEGNAANDILGAVLNKAGKAGADSNRNANGNTLFPTGTRIANNNFTGSAWLHMLVNNDTAFNTTIGNVTFEPGARSNWHYHPGGQILLITSGVGRYGEKGKPVKEVFRGDVIKCDPNIVHWHGAAPNSELTHLAIGTNSNKGLVVWLQPVTDEEYNNYEAMMK